MMRREHCQERSGSGSTQIRKRRDQIELYFVPEAAGSGVFGLAGSSHSILQLGRAFCRAATAAGVTLVCVTFRDFRLLQSSSGDKSDTGVSVASQVRQRHPLQAATGRTPAYSRNPDSSKASLAAVTGRIPAYVAIRSSASSLAAATGRITCPSWTAATTTQNLQSRQRPHRRNIGHVVREKPNLRDHAVLDLGRAFPSSPVTFPSNPGFNSISFLLTASICFSAGRACVALTHAWKAGSCSRAGSAERHLRLLPRPIRSRTWAGLFAASTPAAVTLVCCTVNIMRTFHAHQR